MDSQNTGTVGLRYATDYNLSQLNLVTPMGVLDVSPAMLELNLFEDLFGDTISGEIIIQDTLGILSNYTLSGSEFLQVGLMKTTSDSVSYSRNFRVYKLNKRVTGDSNMYEVFSLMFCSEEFMLAEQYRISKSYPSTTISDIVKSIFGTFLKVQKPVVIQPTTGIYDLVLPNKRIFETLNWLSSYAQSGTSAGDYVFFENSKAFYFTSLSSLFSGPVYQTFRYDPKNISTDMNQMVTNVMDFEVLNAFDTLAGTKNGTFANRVITLDPLQRKANTTAGVYSYQNNFNTGSKLNKNPVINDYTNRLGGKMYEMPPNVPGLEIGSLRMVPGNKEARKNSVIISRNAVQSVANDIMVEKYLPNRVGKLSVSNYQRIKVSVAGDPNLTIGKVVNFQTYQMAPSVSSDAKRQPDPLYAGNYLITTVRHIVKNNSYITVMELCKDSNQGTITGAGTVLSKFANGVQ